MTRTEMIERLKYMLGLMIARKGFGLGGPFTHEDMDAIEDAILILQHISPAELARCLEVAGKEEGNGI